MSSFSKSSKINSLKKKTPTRRKTAAATRTPTSIFQKIRRRGRRNAAGCVCKKLAERSMCSSTSSKVSDKLEALKNLIPANNGEIVKADQLFQETADYIVLLRTQVFVLQTLIEFYGSTTTTTATTGEDSENAVLL